MLDMSFPQGISCTVSTDAEVDSDTTNPDSCQERQPKNKDLIPREGFRRPGSTQWDVLQ